MKKIKILLLLFLLVSIPCFAEDYWVYIRTENRYGVTAEDDVGRSKIGDIVDIRIADYKPSEKEQKEWAIVKVSDIPQEKIDEYKSSWQEEGEPDIYLTKAYRRNKIDIISLNLNLGIYPQVIKYQAIKNKISLKTAFDLLSYEKGQRKYARFRWFRLFVSRLIKPVFAETVSTINKTGQDYDTLTLWEDAKDGDLVTETRQETASCYDDDGDLNDDLNVDGSTTNNAYYMKVTSLSGERHNGKFGTANIGFTLISDANSTNGIILNDDYSIIEWIYVERNTNSSYGRAAISLSGATETIVKNCLISSANAGSGPADGIDLKGSSRVNRALNCMVIAKTEAYSLGNGGTGEASADNCTAFNSSVGFLANYGTNTVNNCIAWGCTTDFDSGFSGDYNMSKDDTSPGNNSIHGDTDGKTVDFVDETAGQEDLHLQSTSDAIDVANDLGTTPSGVQYDIDNRNRDTEGDTWDVGADEYVAAAGGAVPLPIINIF